MDVASFAQANGPWGIIGLMVYVILRQSEQNSKAAADIGRLTGIVETIGSNLQKVCDALDRGK